MPAVTADKLTLPRIGDIRPAARERSVATVTTAPTGLEGEGFPVHRAFAGVPRTSLDPFIHLDQMGEVHYAPGEPKGTPWHPHRGFETVTYMIDGRFQHQDSHGGGGMIQDGATQWMTAGSGILHIETPPEDLVISGGLFHGVQLWVNLPARQKMMAPAYQPLEAHDVTLVASEDAGALVRVIAGDVEDHHGPGSTQTPIAMLHASIEPGARLRLPWNPTFNAVVYMLAGTGRVGTEGRPVHDGQLVTFSAGDWFEIRADDTQDSRSPQLEVLILGGRPIGEHVEAYGPFVMNTKAELGQAFEDFEAGKFGTIPPNALMPHAPDPSPVRTENTGI
ncbi:pirin family protein [Mycolicibacterium hodleri]|uniref:Pirin family protein n=1 Tax=Mycolicibacterium hodleri TaxID=49897 RepID=A0A502E770_9MYCO|nr:pirin family protein [Mycolicibacterium hodleri]TPG33568.1 pirin family protein [Mycolicibacterium hodleri]